jgi:hypothetical protein
MVATVSLDQRLCVTLVDMISAKRPFSCDPAAQ